MNGPGLSCWRGPIGRCGQSSSPARGTGLSARAGINRNERSEEHTSELQSLMRISDAVFCLKKKTTLCQTHMRHYKYIMKLIVVQTTQQNFYKDIADDNER